MIKEGLPKQRFLFFDKLIFYVVYAIWMLSDQGNKFIIYSPLLILFMYLIFNKLLGRKNENYYNKLFIFLNVQYEMVLKLLNFYVKNVY